MVKKQERKQRRDAKKSVSLLDGSFEEKLATQKKEKRK